MMRIIAFAVLVSGGWCEFTPIGVADELYNISRNQPVNFLECSIIPEVTSSKLTYILYTERNSTNGTILTKDNINNINGTNRLILIIHGWLQDGFLLWITRMKDAYISQGGIDVIVLDWSTYSKTPYGVACCAVPQIGKITGNFICYIGRNLGLRLDLVEIVGFSLGCHIAGIAGQEVWSECNKKLSIIHGLDCAGPGFLNSSTSRRLDASDATCVQGIHTNNCFFGYQYPFGTIDFHINSVGPFVCPILGCTRCGTLQPCCPINPGIPTSNDLGKLLPIFFCNHARVLAYFLESINSTDFVGIACDCLRFSAKCCTNTTTAIMGYHYRCNGQGQHYLNPNSIPPFAKGQAGTGGVGGIGGLECFTFK